MSLRAISRLAGSGRGGRRQAPGRRHPTAAGVDDERVTAEPTRRRLAAPLAGRVGASEASAPQAGRLTGAFAWGTSHRHLDRYPSGASRTSSTPSG
jgi:hypothetical protein